MQDAKSYFIGTRSDDQKTGFLTDIYLQSAHAENGSLFSGIVDSRLNCDLAFSEQFAKTIGFNVTKKKAKSCKVEISGKAIQYRIFNDQDVLCHIPFVNINGEIQDGRTRTGWF